MGNVWSELLNFLVAHTVAKVLPSPISSAMADVFNPASFEYPLNVKSDCLQSQYLGP